MKNLTIIILSLFASLFPFGALAHGTHAEQIAGHAHTLTSIAIDSFMVAILLASLFIMIFVWRKNRG